MNMTDHDAVAECARLIADAIGRRDVNTLRSLLSPDFTHRTPGGDAVEALAFLRAIEQIPGEILSVTLERLTVDVSGPAALVTGVQRAEVRVDGRVIEDRRGFVDWFIKEADAWRIRVAVDLPSAEGAG